MKNIIFPPFIEQIEARLITHNPWLWSTRLVRHLWYLTLLNSLAVVIALLYPINLRHIANPEDWFYFLMIPQAVYSLFWIYQQVLHNIERDGGSKNKWLTIPDLFFRWLAFMLIISLSATPAFILTYKVKHAVSDEQFDQETIYLLKTASLTGNRDLFQFFENDEAFLNRNKTEYYLSDSDYYQDFEPNYSSRINDDATNKVQHVFAKAVTAKYYWNRQDDLAKLSNPKILDSIKHYNSIIDSIKYNYDAYWIGGSPFDNYNGYLDAKAMFNADSAFIALRDQTDESLLQHFEKINQIRRLYGDQYEQQAHTAVLRFRKLVDGHLVNGEVDNNLRIRNLELHDYHGEEAERNRNLIARAKGKGRAFSFQEGELDLGYSIFFFVITILLWIFRSTHWKWFILSAATGLGLLIISSISIGLTNGGDNLKIYLWFFTWFGLALFIVLSNLNRKSFSRIVTVSLVLVVAFAPYLPGAIISFVDTELDYFNRYHFDNQIGEIEEMYRSGKITSIELESKRSAINLEQDLHFEKIDTIKFFVFISGLIVMVLISPFVQRVFNKQRALPNSK